MKVVFMESVEGTALVGEVKEVKNGFARNYLLPRGLAAPAVEPYLTRADSRAAIEVKKQEGLDKDASKVAERLEGSRITMTARVGETGRLFGSITSLHIAEEVTKLLDGEEFDHRKVLLPEAIKEVGVQPVRLRLTRNIEAAIEVEVLAEGVEEEDMPVPLDDEAPSANGDAAAVADTPAEATAEADADTGSAIAEADAESTAEADAESAVAGSDSAAVENSTAEAADEAVDNNQPTA